MQCSVGAVLYNAATPREDASRRSRPSPSFSTAMAQLSVPKAFAYWVSALELDVGLHVHTDLLQGSKHGCDRENPAVTSCSRIQGNCSLLDDQGCPERGRRETDGPLLSPCSVTFGPVTLQYLFPHLEFALGVKGGLTQTGASARVRTHWRREQGEGAQRKQSRGNGLDSGELWDSGPSSLTT